MDKHSPALFLGDALALDFLNSVATPVDTPVDWIEDGQGLLRWLEQAGLVSRETLESLQAQALPGELDKVADQARNLREWFRAFVRAHKGKPLKPEALAELEPLNRLLERDEGFGRVVTRRTEAGEIFDFQPMRKWRSPEALLLPVGEAIGRFVCTEDFSNVKACEGPVCTLLFADHTRGHRRRWCSMAMCGNRAKQAAHRDRVRQA
ncbi:CGNR zinc finger domain-containing protein [Rhizobium sp. GCM10022189]|jgi:predicted RNA-binding Zn ribbon-like protein|uniref:CGNR zinc finger domain-containing protein n=1 Tax=Rhizobium sp. GCM10022189 TaxID=3252654 RepID=UPI000DDAEF24